MIKFLCTCSLLISSYAYAGGIITAPERLFRMSGSEVNVSDGDLLYKSQAAGYYSGGGGMVVSSPVKSTQFASIHLPKMQAGCGGIDIYTGGMSFVSGKQLVETLQAISSNAAGFAFMLGLESVSPMITNNIRQLQSWANTVNGIGINSCETAAQLVGSVWPASDMSSQHICRTIGTQKNYPDFIASRHGCSRENSGTNYTREDQQKFGHLIGDYNITWEALMSQPFFQAEDKKELAEMYMTLVGTVVSMNNTPTLYPSKAEDNEFLQHLLEGGKIKKYSCQDREKCLVVNEIDFDISSGNSWFAKIRKTLIEMQAKVKNDEPLDNSEKNLLMTTRLPLFKIINVLTAYHRGAPCSIEMDNIADIIAWDVLAQVINEAIESVRRGCIYLRENNFYSTKLDQLLGDLERVREVVRRYEDHAQKAIDLEMRLIQKTQLLEQQINSEIMLQ